MKTIDVPGGVAYVMEHGDAPIGTADLVKSDEQARVLAAVATIEKESPQAFADELAKVKAKKPDAVPAGEIAAGKDKAK